MNGNGDKMISIIVPVYQAAKTIRRCVSSCLLQKNVDEKKMELILVDDGSTDGSSAICDELSIEHGKSRVKVIHTKNHGVSHARNIGMENASGRYISFVDADDEIGEDFVDNCLKYLEEGIVLVDQTDSYESQQKISGFSYIENSILNHNTHVWGKLFDRQKIVDNHIAFKEGLTIGEDLLFMIDFALSQEKEHTIRCTTDRDYKYNDNEESAMNTAFKASYLDQIVCWREAENKLKPYASSLSAFTFVDIAVSQVLTALLVAGKISAADMDALDKDLMTIALKQVTEQIEHALKTRGAFAALSLGHKIKVMIYRLSPSMYLGMYKRHKGY